MNSGGLDYTNLPGFQRLQQRLATMRPEQRAIIDTAMADRAFAQSEAGKELQAMRMAAQQARQDESLALGRQALDLSGSLADRRMDMADRMDREGEIVGALGVGAGAGLGWMEGEAARERARRYRGLAAQLNNEWEV